MQNRGGRFFGGRFKQNAIFHPTSRLGFKILKGDGNGVENVRVRGIEALPLADKHCTGAPGPNGGPPRTVLEARALAVGRVSIRSRNFHHGMDFRVVSPTLCVSVFFRETFITA